MYFQVGEKPDFDYEKQQNYTVAIRAHDRGEPSFTVDFNVVVVVTDANEPPYDLRLSGKMLHLSYLYVMNMPQTSLETNGVTIILAVLQRRYRVRNRSLWVRCGKSLGK